MGMTLVGDVATSQAVAKHASGAEAEQRPGRARASANYGQMSVPRPEDSSDALPELPRSKAPLYLGITVGVLLVLGLVALGVVALVSGGPEVSAAVVQSESGEQLQKAMGTLKRSIDEEKVALRKQLSEMEERLEVAKSKLSGLGSSTAKVNDGSPMMCDELVKKGHAYVQQGKNKYASLMFMSAVKLMESIGLGRSSHVVPPVSALADLYSVDIDTFGYSFLNKAQR